MLSLVATSSKTIYGNFSTIALFFVLVLHTFTPFQQRLILNHFFFNRSHVFSVIFLVRIKFFVSVLLISFLHTFAASKLFLFILWNIELSLKRKIYHVLNFRRNWIALVKTFCRCGWVYVFLFFTTPLQSWLFLTIHSINTLPHVHMAKWSIQKSITYSM